MIKRSFALRIFCVLFFILGVPLLINSFFFFQDFYKASIELARTNLKEIADFRSYTIKALLPIPNEGLKDLIYFLKLDNGVTDRTFIDEQLQQVSRLEPGVDFYILGTPDDAANYPVLASSLKQLPTHSVKSYETLRKVFGIGEGGFVRRLPDDLFLFTAKAIEKQGAPLGILLAGSNIQQAIDTQLLAEDKGTVGFALLTQDGIVVAATNSQLEGNYFENLTPERRAEILETQQLGNLTLASFPLHLLEHAPFPFVDFVFDQAVYLAYRTYLPDLGVSLIAYTPQKRLFSEALGHFTLVYIAYAVMITIGLILAYLLSRKIASPLRQLSEVMQEAHRGNLAARFHEERFGFEINFLGNTFNHTLEALLTNIKLAEDERVEKEIYQKEVNIGREVQQTLLAADHPVFEGVRTAATYLPALQVGGDFYCVDRQGEDALWLAVGDASGKGISSSLFALSARSLMRTYAALYDDVGKILSATNNAFLEDAAESGMFVTALMGIYFIKTRQLSYYSCGHVPGIVRRKDGSLQTLAHSGMALGLLTSTLYQADLIQLAEGDIVVFYTKGLIEGVNDKHQYFSEKRVRELLQQRKWQTASEVVEGLAHEFRTFVGATVQEDEVVIVALQVV